MAESNVRWVLDRLKAGAAFRVGGGRYNQTFKWIDGKLIVQTFDEGSNFDEDATLEQLAKAVAENPDAFPELA